MTLKLRFGLYLALGAGILTLLVGAFNSVTLVTVLYRTLVSLVLFAVLGYTCGQFAERFLQEKLAETMPKGRNIDIVSHNEHGDELSVPAAEFKPLNPDNFENITLTQK
ncbi:hypothetical protein SCACP_16380 [Sporomusa carbonis]|uniref:hypothetical protein n=1 Tax=Sporomusa carbonis TaxID=3076075 RepID=UPI003A658DCB